MQKTNDNYYGNKIDYEFGVKVKNKPLKEYEYQGDTYIEGRKGSEYELYFKNNTYLRVLVVLSVDGLSVIDGKTASDKSQGYVVEAGRELLVPGWSIDNTKAAKFQFQPQHDKANTTYVETLYQEGFDVDPDNQGVIGCMVFKEKPPVYGNQFFSFISPAIIYEDNYTLRGNACGGRYNGDNLDYFNPGGWGLCSSSMGADSMPTSQCFMSSSSQSMNSVDNSLGTAFGEDTKFETTTTTFNRMDYADWIAVINYDTIQGLRKRGIFIESKQAKAFPNMSQEGFCHIPKKRRRHG